MPLRRRLPTASSPGQNCRAAVSLTSTGRRRCGRRRRAGPGHGERDAERFEVARRDPGVDRHRRIGRVSRPSIDEAARSTGAIGWSIDNPARRTPGMAAAPLERRLVELPHPHAVGAVGADRQIRRDSSASARCRSRACGTAASNIVRPSSAAGTSSSTAKAHCATARPRRRRADPGGRPRPLAGGQRVAGATRDQRHAGASPNSTAVTSAAATVNATRSRRSSPGRARHRRRQQQRRRRAPAPTPRPIRARAEAGQHQALDQQLARQPHPAGAERSAHGEFALPALVSASSRLPRLVQPASSSSSTVPKSTSTSSRDRPATASRYGVTTQVIAVFSRAARISVDTAPRPGDQRRRLGAGGGERHAGARRPRTLLA